jgi:hypothetical protein
MVTTQRLYIYAAGLPNNTLNGGQSVDFEFTIVLFL